MIVKYKYKETIESKNLIEISISPLIIKVKPLTLISTSISKTCSHCRFSFKINYNHSDKSYCIAPSGYKVASYLIDDSNHIDVLNVCDGFRPLINEYIFLKAGINI